MAKNFNDRLAERKALGAKTDTLDEEIVTEFLTAASPIIAMLRSIQENMSDSTSFAARAKQVLSAIDNGLLRDPMAISVIDKMRAEQAPNQSAAPAEDTAPKK